jgi:hypothetical protein
LRAGLPAEDASRAAAIFNDQRLTEAWLLCSTPQARGRKAQS